MKTELYNFYPDSEEFLTVLNVANEEAEAPTDKRFLAELSAKYKKHGVRMRLAQEEVDRIEALAGV